MKSMKLVYWGGGIKDDRIAGFKQFLDLMKAEPAYHKIPDLRNPHALILGNLLGDMEDKELYGEENASNFMQIASPSVNHDFEKNADTKARSRHSATTFMLKNDPNNQMLKRYQKLSTALGENTKELYEQAKKRLDKLGIPYFVVPGWNDTVQMLDVFEDKVLHAGTVSLEDRLVLGVGALDSHEASLPQRSRIVPQTSEKKSTVEQDFLDTNEEAQKSDVLITPYFMDEHFTREVAGNSQYRTSGFGHVLNAFAKGPDGAWFTNRGKRQRKLIITSANHTGRHTEASPMAGGVVLNAGKNVTLNSHGAYCITLGPDGVEKIGAVYIRGNAHTVFKPSGDTFAGDMGHTTYCFNIKDAAKYPGANEQAIVEYVAPGGKYDGTVKRVKTQKIKRAQESEDLHKKITRVREAKKAVEVELNESHRDFRKLNRAYKDLCNAYGSLAYKFVERKQYKMGTQAYLEALDFAPDIMQEMRAAMIHNIGIAYDARNKPLDALAFYGLANDEMPQHGGIRKAYEAAVNKFMKK